VPLDPSLAAAAEPLFDHSFGDVRVHDGAEASHLAGGLDAAALSIGSDIFFQQGVFGTDTPEQRHVLAHELAHVVQHDDRQEPSLTDAVALSLAPENDASEVAADDAARSVLSGQPASLHSTGTEASPPGQATVHRFPGLDWLSKAAGSVVDAGASVLGMGGPPAAVTHPAGPSPGPGDATAAPAAPGPDKKDAPDPKRVAAATSQLAAAMEGWGTDEDAIYSALRGKSAAEVAAIKAEYQKSTGHSLEAALSDEMSGDELGEAMGYLSGDPAKGVVGALVNASSGLGTDEAKLMSSLQDMSPDDYLRVKKEFKARTGQSLDDMIQDELSGAELTDAKKALDAKFGTGLGKGVDDIVKQSPTLRGQLDKIADEEWTVRYGPAGGGYEADSVKKVVTIDPKLMGDGTTSANVVMQLAHEVGHSVYKEDPYVAPDGRTKDEYVQQNTMRHLKNEGAATVNNLIIRNEVLGAKGPDIDVAGQQSEKYKALYAKYPDPKDREKLLQEVGQVYAKGETPSGNSGAKNYEDYYSKEYKSMYDDWLKAQKKK